ncbi:MAG: Asp-tRNA(Asn)/Glu-tRNA(Gln) amidotransferase subunit GatB [Gemmatimonadetes bacterium]|nr:aspartyl/glutamyl-tRNA amidotransferase subunit C [Gemmatimonadota bacterium]NIR79016.1 aspartyl/glutamyl-tRNA amidotransferase subunit C [Gemmatimonadota bacterium]NIT87660.1 aspartyl/glutamyl-tRNA amidotransferase subunit C [Gemmatimonadota bacterium]NIU31527.1 aspartyl/glutamyl-tRNA amidotransferase subunit C [Gemmatimonadota bacterium]NIU36187.1 Asp-tRNA(Asn)/Glu-tRNA(Gln) amidotransferase subunit GatB [Gemmatimonadota bacterium]
MGVTRDEVEHVAGLARLRLDDDEAAALTEDLDEILGHMEALASVTDDSPGDGSPVHNAPAPLRPDGEGSPDALLRPPEELAPDWDEGFFVVPRLPGLEDDGGTEDEQE